MSENRSIKIKLITGKKVFYEELNNHTHKKQYYEGEISTNTNNNDEEKDKVRFSIKNPTRLNLDNAKDEFQGDNNNNRDSKEDSNLLNKKYNHIQSSYLNDFIGINYNNIVVLAGAGSSISSKAKKDKKSKSGLTMYDLADYINQDLLKLKENTKNIKCSYYDLLEMAKISKFFNVNNKFLKNYEKFNKSKLKDEEEQLAKKYRQSRNESSNLFHTKFFHMAVIFNNFELLLSTVIEYKDFIKYINHAKKINHKYSSEVDIYKNTIEEIRRKIRSYCNLTFNSNDFDHANFIQKLQQLNVKGKRLKIYSTNYDTLFEQAAIKLKDLVVDGFNYRPKRTFNENSLNMDFITRKDDNKDVSINNANLYPNVVKIFQIHGSEDWYRDIQTGRVYKADHDSVTNKINSNRKRYKPCMIFPSNNKYEQSYNDPYFDLFLNFQKDLRENNTLLIIVGFSLSDMHIRRMVYDSMLINNHLSMIYVSFGGVGALGSNDSKKHVTVSINNNLNDFFRSGFLSRELFLTGTLNDFEKSLDIPKIYNKN